MKKHIIIALTALSLIAAWILLAKGCIYKPSDKGEKITQLQKDGILEDGDIIFQESQSSQCKAVQKATNSRYSHCGIIFKKDGKYFVYEAIEPVTQTQLNHWINRGKDNHYVVKRLKDSDKVLSPDVKKKMKDEAKKHFGKKYDLSFSWTDDQMYCSELIWKIYERGANIKIGKLEKLGNFDLSHPIVQKKVKERYGDNTPKDELVISPASIFSSELLYTISEN